MVESFLHGTEVIELDDGARPVQTVRTAVIGLVGTAPDADANVFPLDQPVLVTSLVQVDKLKAATGDPTGTLYGACQDIFAQVSAAVVIVRVAEGSGATPTDILANTLPNIIGGSSGNDYTGMQALLGAKSKVDAHPRICIAPGFTSVRPTGGTVSVSMTNKGSGYTTAPTVGFSGGGGANAAGTAVLASGVTSVTVGAGGTGYTGTPTVAFSGGGGTGAAGTVTVSSGVVTGIVITNPGTGYTSAPTATVVGAGTGATLTAVVTKYVASVTMTNNGTGYTTAPTVAFTGGGGSGAAGTAVTGAFANPVAGALANLGERLRSVSPILGPNTNDADAHAYRDDHGSRRLYMVDPGVKILRGNTITGVVVDADPVAAIAGLIAKIDNDKGFWNSPSNNVINGIQGTTRSVDFTLGDTNSRANLLNEDNIATIIRDGGFRLWGNRTLSTDPRWAFLSTVRTADIIADSLMRAHLWAVDRCIGRAYVDAVVESVNSYLRLLQSQGAILGGQCWADPTVNTPALISAGKVFFDFDFTPPFPAERVTFRSHLVNDYVVNILS
jgi:phage tail sheath protein FI